jgi:hypothetical protein
MADGSTYTAKDLHIAYYTFRGLQGPQLPKPEAWKLAVGRAIAEVEKLNSPGQNMETTDQFERQFNEAMKAQRATS